LAKERGWKVIDVRCHALDWLPDWWEGVLEIELPV